MRKLSVITLIVAGAFGAGGSALSLAAANAVPAAASAPAAAPVQSAVQNPPSQGQAAGVPAPSQRSMWHKLQAAKLNQAPASAPVSAPPAAP